MRRNLVLPLSLGLMLSALAVSAARADDVVYGGIDVWRTPGNGGTFYDFSADPLPAGFFCQRSQPFSERVVLQGTPLTTGKAGELRTADTVIQRLDDARFDARGLAASRVQVRALSLESVAPIRTACGSYQVQVSLAGDQPLTRMNLVRETAAGGRFLAPLSMNVKISFVPVSSRGGATREVARLIRFPANPLLRWSSDLLGRGQHVSPVKVDTDGDRVPDTILPGTSNFAVRAVRGEASGNKGVASLCQDATVYNLDGSVCHCYNGVEEHCTEPF
jgi:hypothetical protein